jgi:hypothetical protein
MNDWQFNYACGIGFAILGSLQSGKSAAFCFAMAAIHGLASILFHRIELKK